MGEVFVIGKSKEKTYLSLVNLKKKQVTNICD